MDLGFHLCVPRPLLAPRLKGFSTMDSTPPLPSQPLLWVPSLAAPGTVVLTLAATIPALHFLAFPCGIEPSLLFSDRFRLSGLSFWETSGGFLFQVSIFFPLSPFFRVCWSFSLFHLLLFPLLITFLVFLPFFFHSHTFLFSQPCRSLFPLEDPQAGNAHPPPRPPRLPASLDPVTRPVPVCANPLIKG